MGEIFTTKQSIAMTSRHRLYTIQMTEKPTNKLDKDKYKGLDSEFLLSSITFAEDIRIGDSRGNQSRYTDYPTFSVYHLGGNSDNRDNSDECTNLMREQLRSDVEPQKITLSEWEQHSVRNDEYVLVRKQTINDAKIASDGQSGGEITHFVLQSQKKGSLDDVTQTKAQ